MIKVGKLNLLEAVKKGRLSQEFKFRNIIAVCFFLNIFVVGVIFLLKKNNLPPEVPLYYGLPEGEPQLTSSLNLIFPGIFSLIIISLNFLIASFVKDGFLKDALIITGFVVTLFSIITIIKIVFLVGSF